MRYRSLIWLSGLTLGDYLLWDWSAAGNHDVLSLVSGFTLPPLAAVLVWLLALNLARVVIARSSRRSGPRAEKVLARGRTGMEPAPGVRRAAPAATDQLSEPAVSTTPADSASRRIAA